MITLDTYLASDHHFGHKTISSFEPSRLTLGEFPEQTIIDLHNSIVRPNDQVLFLGDFSFKNPLDYSGRLKGNLSLILGNHDRKGQQPYTDFERVYRGCHIDWNGLELIYHDSDPLLSAVIQEVEGIQIGFCHYTIGYHDYYDDQRTLAKQLAYRKEVLDKLFDTMSVEVVIHGHLHSRSVAEGKYKYINVCLEHQEFKPMKLGNILEREGLL